MSRDDIASFLGVVLLLALPFASMWVFTEWRSLVIDWRHARILKGARRQAMTTGEPTAWRSRLAQWHELERLHEAPPDA